MIHLLLKTKQFIPNEFHDTFFDIDFTSLYNQGYRLILTDLDNTLISYAETTPNNQIHEKFQQLKELGFEIILVSNNMQERINAFCEPLDVQGFASARKPLLYGFKKAFDAKKIPATRSETIIIGDQLMTDIYGANRFGVYNILVNPIKRKTEKWYTKFNRRIEEKMLQKIKQKYPENYRELELDKRG